MNRIELVTVEEMAAILKVKKSWLYYHLRQDDDEVAIPRVYVGKYIRFNPDQVMDWIRLMFNDYE